MANEITLTQGDDITLTFRVKSDASTNHDMTGATSLEAHFVKSDGSILRVSSGFTIDPDQVTNKGKVTLALAAADTDKLKPGENQSVLLKFVQSAKTLHVHGIKILRVRRAIPAG